METTNSNQILDNLLRFIEEHSTRELRPHFTLGQLIELIQELKPDLGGYETPNSGYILLRMIDKLVKDKYISFQLMPLSKPEAERIKYYEITFEGGFFIKNTGYVKQHNDTNFEKNRIKKQDEQIRLLTMFLAIGSIGVLIIEALRFLLDYFL